MIVVLLLKQFLGGIFSHALPLLGWHPFYFRGKSKTSNYVMNNIPKKVLIEVESAMTEYALTEGDYDFRISKDGRYIKRLFIQNETLMAEYRFQKTLLYDFYDSKI